MVLVPQTIYLIDHGDVQYILLTKSNGVLTPEFRIQFIFVRWEAQRSGLKIWALIWWIKEMLSDYSPAYYIFIN